MSAEKLIVSRHKATADILKNMFPEAEVFSKENVAPEDISGKIVYGTLPPHLIQYCKSYKAATIKNFDYSKDGDLKGEELLARLHISDAIIVEVNN